MTSNTCAFLEMVSCKLVVSNGNVDKLHKQKIMRKVKVLNVKLGVTFILSKCAQVIPEWPLQSKFMEGSSSVPRVCFRFKPSHFIFIVLYFCSVIVLTSAASPPLGGDES